MNEYEKGRADMVKEVLDIINKASGKYYMGNAQFSISKDLWNKEYYKLIKKITALASEASGEPHSPEGDTNLFVKQTDSVVCTNPQDTQSQEPRIVEKGFGRSPDTTHSQEATFIAMETRTDVHHARTNEGGDRKKLEHSKPTPSSHIQSQHPSTANLAIAGDKRMGKEHQDSGDTFADTTHKSKLRDYPIRKPLKDYTSKNGAKT